ncbi:FliH/SctL family protein [Anaeromyxobacter sp. PSR-1]|uniref:FliH/SctL family protein n=1 Tax=Anaeromyxobacter sp. PSR-1 TaxID=1300915 RepID=UPI0005E917F9|nr:FliH/SctL family protein [Anaeromyxobacter sp. PSR-1]GAO03911.1 flagellar assembly protein FliH [Anaeromyxobacter sp. PSR-1]
MSRVLKDGPGGRRIEGAIYAAGARARALVDDARAEAARLVEAAAAEREAIRAEAVREGREEGMARAAAALATAGEARAARLAGLEREVARLALDVARQLLGRELAAAPEAVADLAARALARAKDCRELVLRASPADAALLRAEPARSRLAALLARPEGPALREDPALPPGAVVVETEAGRIDARVEAQLAALERALEEAP